jgi:hypothetical protein
MFAWTFLATKFRIFPVTPYTSKLSVSCWFPSRIPVLCISDKFLGYRDTFKLEDESPIWPPRNLRLLFSSSLSPSPLSPIPDLFVSALSRPAPDFDFDFGGGEASAVLGVPWFRPTGKVISRGYDPFNIRSPVGVQMEVNWDCGPREGWQGT